LAEHRGGFVEVTIKAGTYVSEEDKVYAIDTVVMRTDKEAHEYQDNGYLIEQKSDPDLSSDEVMTWDDVFGNWEKD